MVKLVKKTDCSIPTLHEGSKLVDQSSDKALVLNNYFHSCFSTSQPPLVGIIDRLEPGNCPSNILCTEEEVFDLVASLDISKSTGPDGVSQGDRYFHYLQLFNQSISQRAFPNNWKIARIVPVPENSDKSLSKNYRPISILPLVSKLLERHIHKLILNHFMSFHPISLRQCGFMSGRSTTSALLTVTHDILHTLDDGDEVCSVSLT